MVTGSMDLMNEGIVKRDKIIITAAEPWEQWYGVTSQRLRSIDETQPSLKSFITSGACEQYADINRESRSRMQCQIMKYTNLDSSSSIVLSKPCPNQLGAGQVSLAHPGIKFMRVCKLGQACETEGYSG